MNGKSWVRWQDWTNLVAGIYMLFVPSMYATTTAASWDAYILGAVIALIGLWGLAIPRSRSAEWTQVVAGAWLFVAPWVLGFTAVAAAAWNAWIVGIIVVVLASWALAQIAAGHGIETQAGSQHLPHAA